MLNLLRRSVLKGAAAAAALTIGLTALPHAASAETELRVVPHSGLKILDPIWTTAYITRNHGYMIYDTLFAMDPDGNVQPQMVDSVSRSDDGKTVTITLRDGLKWHDGAAVTATDTVASINRWASKDAMGQKMMTFVDSLEATDDKTMVFTLNAPTGLIELALAKPSSNVPFMMPARIAATPGDEQIAEYIGSGPFSFNNEEWEPGVKVVYEKFDDYVPRSEATNGFAGAKIAKVDRVIWTPNRDIQQAINALNAGEVDIIESTPPDLLPLVAEGGQAYTQSPNPAGLQYTFRFNVLHPPFDNPKIRQALLYAFNQEDFMQATIGDPNYYKACKAMFICGTPLETDAGFEDKLESNFKKARELLKEGGYDGTPVLLDFGAARDIRHRESGDLTRILTPGYAPYEQENPDWHEQGPWTDIYALAATLYYAVCGKRPASGGQRAAAVFGGRDDPYVPLSDLQPEGYSPRFLQAIDQALAFDPSARPSNTTAWNDLFVDPEPEPAVTTAPQTQKSRSRTPLFAGLGLLVILAAGGFWWQQQSTAPTAKPVASSTPATEAVTQETSTPGETESATPAPPPEPVKVDQTPMAKTLVVSALLLSKTACWHEAREQKISGLIESIRNLPETADRTQFLVDQQNKLDESREGFASNSQKYAAAVAELGAVDEETRSAAVSAVLESEEYQRDPVYQTLGQVLLDHTETAGVGLDAIREDLKQLSRNGLMEQG